MYRTKIDKYNILELVYLEYMYFMGSATPLSACYALFFLHKLNRHICTFLKYWV